MQVTHECAACGKREVVFVNATVTCKCGRQMKIIDRNEDPPPPLRRRR